MVGWRKFAVIQVLLNVIVVVSGVAAQFDDDDDITSTRKDPKLSTYGSAVLQVLTEDGACVSFLETHCTPARATAAPSFSEPTDEQIAFNNVKQFGGVPGIIKCFETKIVDLNLDTVCAAAVHDLKAMNPLAGVDIRAVFASFTSVLPTPGQPSFSPSLNPVPSPNGGGGKVGADIGSFVGGILGIGILTSALGGIGYITYQRKRQDGAISYVKPIKLNPGEHPMARNRTQESPVEKTERSIFPWTKKKTIAEQREGTGWTVAEQDIHTKGLMKQLKRAERAAEKQRQQDETAAASAAAAAVYAAEAATAASALKYNHTFNTDVSECAFTLGANGTLKSNNGTLKSNNGTLKSNNGTMGSKNGTMGSKNGTMGSKNGAMGSQNGTMGSQNGTMGSKNGPLRSKNGTLKTNNNRPLESNSTRGAGVQDEKIPHGLTHIL